MKIEIVLTYLSCGVYAQTYTLSVPSAAPTNAPIVDPAFPAFAFEEASFVPYTTNNDGSPNTFTQNLINAVVSRTGTKPIIRVGGTSGDHATFDQSLNMSVSPVMSRTTRPAFGNLTVGPSYFDTFKNLPGAGFIVNIPLVKMNLNNAMTFAKRYWTAIGAQNMQAIEIGNEPDLYNPSLSQQTYANLVNQYEDEIAGNISDFPKGPIFQGPDGARVDGYPADKMIPVGFDSQDRLKSYSFHYYQATIPPNGKFDVKTIMNHTAIAKGLDAFGPQVDFLAKNTSGKVPFVLTEVGNTLLSSPTMPDPGYVARNNLGSALWAVDFQLYAMSMGIGRVHLQQILSAGYSLWLPIDSDGDKAQVRPNFYSQPFVADFIGKSNKTQVANVHVAGGSGYSGLCGYAAYDAGKLSRVAVVNFNFWSNYTPGSTGQSVARPVQIVRLNIPKVIQSATLQTLTSPDGAYGNSTLTWRGLQWRFPDGKEVQVRNDSKPLTINNGAVDVPVNASEAVMVVFS